VCSPPPGAEDLTRQYLPSHTFIKSSRASSNVCCRLRQVQALLCGSGTAIPDGILCSLGIDSRYNEGCTELAKYLFYGLYEQNQVNLEHGLEEFPEEMLDDVILLIKVDCVHLYCNPLNYSYLLPYVSHWRNLHLYCMTETEYEDEEAAEEFKISSFVAMVQDCYHIGVPYSSQGQIQKFDMFMVEKWPLLQAFALEGIGGGSFFTMKYKLMDMSENLWQVYNRLDPVSLDNLLTEDLVNFEKQWNGFFSGMDLESHLSILELSEAQAGEQPYVLFGKHSALEDLENYLFNFPSESHQVRNTGPQGSAARHMILQCVAPKGPLACARTYFFGTTHNPYLGNQNTEQKKTDVLVLSQIYSAAIQAVLSGIKCYSCTTSATKAKDVAENTFLMSLDSMNLMFSLCYLKTISQIDAFLKLFFLFVFRIIPLTNEDSHYVIKTASLIVHDIPDLQWDRGELGSVVFSESFLESSINIQQRDGTVSSDSCYTILTATVPRYACWLVCVKVSIVEKPGRNLAFSILIFLQSFKMCFIQILISGKIIFFSEGLFIHSQYGSITISKDHINKVKFYNPDYSTVASLFVEYEDSLLPHLPFPLHSSDRCLVFALLPRSKSQRAFYSKVRGICFRVDILFSSFRHTKLQKLHDSQEPPMAKRRGSLKTSYCQLPGQEMFLQHFALSSIGQEPIMYDHLGMLFPSAELRNIPPCQGDKVVITIITGLPGSHKKILCNFSVQLNHKCERWVVYEPAPESFSASHLQKYLSSFLESQRGTRGKPRLLVLTPGYTDVLDVVQAVLFHPDPVVQACFTIGAVTACVNPLTSFIEHRFAFPKLLEQLSQGIVSTVVFTGLTAEKKHPLMQHVQQLVRSANPTAAFILAERGAVTRDEDMNLILSESSFNEPQMLRAPIKSSLRPSPFQGNMYNVWGKVRFSDSDQLMEVSYNALSGNLRIVPEDNSDPLSQGPKETNTSCFLFFDGVGLTEDGLKDWLRLCAKQKQAKKTKKTKSTLSPQEIKSIHMTRHLEPLPPGYFYNGYQYVDIFGDKTNFHPNTEEFIKEYIAEANKEIEQFNCQLESQGQPDLFEP
uniref:Dynein axonemal assembly factor 9 n=1 Tax=Maylandia zebra TaxID=106582 RepID=A0A3P9B212_9CICH